ncbi:MAG: hypothetical protein HF314_07780 [Ignavibacteria bacterium]|nr:hypothetical protein [Ignavibacteria bacterium]MCU7502957.1 hypothetical protein [Ignavibacteria bacterium]MCU7517060.1 hypothetical protein [Ignavibacteria bacterium]
MKYFLTCCVVILLTIDLFPDGPDAARTIYIFTKDEDVAAFRTMGKILNSSGYDLEDSEEALMVITTEIMNKDYGTFNLDKIALRLRAEIDMRDSITIIKLSGSYLEKGMINQALAESYFDQHSIAIAHCSASSPAGETAWNYMMGVAQKYKNGKILVQ